MPPTAVQQAAEVVYGAPFKSDMFNSSRIGRPLLRIRDLATHDPGVYTTERHPREAVVKPGEVVVGMDGEFRAHLWQGPSSLLNQRMCLFRPVSGVPRAYVLESLREPLDLVERSKTGTTVIHLSKADIDGFRFPPSSREVLDSFASATEPVLDAVVRNAAEAKVLAAVRDELLPRLLSGGGDRR
jgi:type I restriction enzyme S subunit